MGINCMHFSNVYKFIARLQNMRIEFLLLENFQQFAFDMDDQKVYTFRVDTQINCYVSYATGWNFVNVTEPI